MRINVLDTIKNYEGKEVFEENSKTSIIFRTIFNNALNLTAEREVIPAEQKAKIFELSLKLFKGKEVDLTLDERTLIKERVAKFYSPLIYGRVSEILEEPKKE